MSNLSRRVRLLETAYPRDPPGDLDAAWERLRLRVEAAAAANDCQELLACYREGLRLSAHVPRVDTTSEEYRRLAALPHDELRRLHAGRLGLLRTRRDPGVTP